MTGGDNTDCEITCKLPQINSTGSNGCYLADIKRANDADTSNEFLRSDGTPASFETFFLWEPGHPIPSPLDCACVRKFSESPNSLNEYRLVSINCTSKQRVVCSRLRKLLIRITY